MKYKIVADSSSDLLELEGVDYAYASLKLSTDEREFVDNAELDVDEMVDYFKSYKGRAGSSCPSPGDWEDAFGDADYVFAVTITSALSGSYSSALTAKRNYESSNPGKKVFVVDSLSAGPELVLIIEKLRAAINAGREYSDICLEIKAYQKHTRLFFTLESLTNLANNGRVNKAVAKIAGALGIRLLGKASTEGELQPINKCRGELKTINTVLTELRKEGYAGGRMIIHHCRNLKFAERLSACIASEFNAKDIVISKTRGLCSFYAELGGLLIGFEV